MPIGFSETPVVLAYESKQEFNMFKLYTNLPTQKSIVNDYVNSRQQNNEVYNKYYYQYINEKN